MRFSTEEKGFNPEGARWVLSIRSYENMSCRSYMSKVRLHARCYPFTRRGLRCANGAS